MKYLTIFIFFLRIFHLEAFSVPDNKNEFRSALKNEEMTTKSRRNFLIGAAGASIIGLPFPSYAGEVGAMITKAVTQSDLGISVRRSVVRGAQIFDKLDGQWEKFSDDNHLGAQRFNQQPRPKPREVPDLQPLNVPLANQILNISDQTFLNLSGISSSTLESQIKKIDELVRKSFYRAGLNFDYDMSAKEFNYFCYIHFKAYCDIVKEKNVSFDVKSFETQLGETLLSLFYTQASDKISSLSRTKKNTKAKEYLSIALNTALEGIDIVLKALVSNGFVARAERNFIDQERLQDWSADMADIQLSIPLDGDATLNGQILLQEQGMRIYPDFSRFIIAALLRQCLEGTNQNVADEEYYMDTGYSTDSFEVKQVLLNIVIDSS